MLFTFSNIASASIGFMSGAETAYVRLSLYERSLAVACSERKYLPGASVSKMSDKEHALAVLRDAVVFAINHFPFHPIPEVGENPKNGRESFSFVVTK